MKKFRDSNIVVTGIGITSSIGNGKNSFLSALLNGESKFDYMKRPNRQSDHSKFIGAEIELGDYPDTISKRVLRTATFSEKVAMVTLAEAWSEAKLDEVDPYKIGLVVGGSNVSQREQFEIFNKYKDSPEYIRPTYALSYMDTDMCGICTEQFGIKGMAYTCGGASASGQMSIIQAVEAVRSNKVDVCIALGAVMDLSYLECNAFCALGAMGTEKFANEPEKACRPFDVEHDGFIYGENCGVLIIESEESALKRGAKIYGEIAGCGICMDANRNPNPSKEGEKRAITLALEDACLTAKNIDYVNTHGTGSKMGDETELAALQELGLQHAYINATKSITGHGLSAAGIVEAVAVFLQMEAQMLHPTNNLENPIDKNFNWIVGEGKKCNIQSALNISLGFGGINTAICIKKYL